MLRDKGLQVLDGLPDGDAPASVVQVDDDIAVIAHAELLHVGKLPQAVTGLDALHQGMVLLLGHGVDHVHAGLVDGQDVGRGKDAHIGSNHRFGGHALAVAGDGHVAHHIDIRYVLAEIVRYRLA